MPLTTSPSCLMSDGLLSVVTDRIHQQQVGLGQHTRAGRARMARFGTCAKLVRRRQTAAQALNARPRPPNSSGDIWDAAEARMTQFSACAKLARRHLEMAKNIRDAHTYIQTHHPR